jgi:hypothetical protein
LPKGLRQPFRVTLRLARRGRGPLARGDPPTVFPGPLEREAAGAMREPDPPRLVASVATSSLWPSPG